MSVASGAAVRAESRGPDGDPGRSGDEGRLPQILKSPQLMTALAGLGVALRLWAFAASSSLGLDEILLSRNILGLPLRDLLVEPLRLDQVAPRGFLLVEKLAVLALGPGEHALRLFPFVAGVAAVLLFRRLAQRSLEGLAAPFALALFAVGVPLLRYSAEVKQYETDAAASIVVMLLALDLRARETSLRRRVAFGLLGALVAWFSQPSVVLMGGIGLAFAAGWLRSRDRRLEGALFVTLPLWAAACVAAIIAGRHSMTPSTKAFMDAFWAQGFMPRSPPLAALQWFPERGVSLFGDPTLLRYPLPALFLALALAGLVVLFRERREIAGILIGPLFVALAAGVARQYPFHGRVAMYLVPVVLLAIAAFVHWLSRQAARLHPALGAAVLAIILALPASALLKSQPPYIVEHTEAMLSYLQQHRRPGDPVYVFPLQRIGVLYYGDRYGLSPADWTTGVCDPVDTRAYLRDLDRYRGVERLWVYSAVPRPFRTASAAVQGYLGTIGIRRDSFERPSLIFGSSRLVLYDLSDPGRLASAAAATFPVEPMPTDPRPGCRPWSSPSPVDSFR